MVQARILARVGGLAAALTVGAAPASAADFSERQLHESRADVLDYWTPERMAKARPATQLLRGVSLDALPPVIGERGKPWSVPGATPDRRAGLLDDLLGGGAQARRATPVSDPSRSPFRTHGKVFFTLDANYQCSATAVTAKHKRLVVTAGHCAYDGFLGGFARNWMFIPGKDGGSEPYGRWTAAKLATTRQWIDSTQNASIEDDDVRFDVAFAKIKKRNGKRLQKVVGARGMAFNQSRSQVFNAFGYPAEPPFDGDDPFLCSSPGEGTDSNVSSPRPTRIECDMTGGSSGGGWVIGGGRVNSVTSYGYECPSIGGICVGPDPDGTKLYGPYFGETIKHLYKSQRRKRR